LVLGAAESVIGYCAEFTPHPEQRVVLMRRPPAEAGQLLAR